MKKTNRRHFLCQLGALAATASVANSVNLCAAEGKRNHAKGELKLGLVTYNLGKDMDLPTLISNCEKTGFEGVELRTTHAHKVEVNLSASEREDVKKRFADSPVNLVSLGSAFEFQMPDQEVLAKNIRETKEYIQLAHDVGASAVKVRPNGLPAGVPKEKTLEQIGKAFREVAVFGWNLGIDIRMEVHGPQTCLLPNMKVILDVADHPNANICWNSNMDDLSGEGFDYNYNLVKDKIKICHIIELWDERYPWRKLFANLVRDGFRGYTLAEIPENNDPVRIMRYYRALWLAMQPQ